MANFEKINTSNPDREYYAPIIKNYLNNYTWLSPVCEFIRQDINEALDTVSSLEKNILELYHGINCPQVKSYQKIAQQLHISPRQASNMHQEAIDKLQLFFKFDKNTEAKNLAEMQDFIF